MDKRFIICISIISVLIALGFLIYSNLEIYQRQVYFPPSNEVYNNEYFALERWLTETGHPVRTEKWGTVARIARAREKVVLVQATACQWQGAQEILKPWMEEGGFLVISLDYDFMDIMDEDLLEFLLDFGIGVDEEPETLPNPSDDSPQQEFSQTEEEFPDFSENIYFYAVDDANIFTMDDSKGYARLAEVSIGKGALTVIGKPWFFYSYNLERKINAGLSWNLTGARAAGDNAGLLFIRDKYLSKSLFGKLIERGNITVVIISALFVIFLGFWMVVPVFGLVFAEKQKNSRPIRERFLAEIRFLKKHGALDYYLDIYERELKFKDTREEIGILREKQNTSNKYRDIIKRLRKFESISEQF